MADEILGRGNYVVTSNNRANQIIRRKLCRDDVRLMGILYQTTFDSIASLGNCIVAVSASRFGDSDYDEAVAACRRAGLPCESHADRYEGRMSKIDRQLPAVDYVSTDFLAPYPSAGTGRTVAVCHLADFSEDNAVLAPTPWYLTPEAVFTIILLLGAALSIASLRRRAYGTLSRVFDTVFFGVLGLTGCVLTFLIFVSVHEATSPNWLYVWLNPLCLIPAIFLWLKKGKCVLICYQIINFAVLLIFVAVWPFLPQSANPAFLPVILTEMLRSATYVRLTATASRRNKR